MSELIDLEREIARLKKENSYLKRLLDDAKISYNIEQKQTDYQEDQGALIIPKTSFTDREASLFFSMFWGRMDVYSKRVIIKSTGNASYYPQCKNFWQSNCPKKTNKSIRCSQCRNADYIPLGKQQILNHLRGEKEDGSDVIGIYPLFPDDTCRFIVFDFDNHEKDAYKNDYANTDFSWKEEVDALREICKINHVDALVERSRSGKGAHVWIFFEKNISAKLARDFGYALLREGAQSTNLKTFTYYDRLIPMQDHLPKGGFGNLIALPLQGQALKVGNSAFVDENWNAYPDQWDILFSKRKLSEAFIKEKLKEWNKANDLTCDTLFDSIDDNVEKPWNRTNAFIKDDVQGAMQIVLADGIYVLVENLKPRIQNRIREMAAFANPIFYKNQAMDLSNFNQARFIYLGQETNKYLCIPKGLLDDLLECCKNAGIKVEMDDQRCAGKTINVCFNGQLKKEQEDAITNMQNHDMGILHAATAFGKTVVCCNMIARKKVNTLIILQSSALIEQWMDALQNFLIINEELPTYKTPSGKIKKRNNLIGRIQGAHDSSTGIIDIAMVGSLCKKGAIHPRFKDYGMIIVDECHHAASQTFIEVLQQTHAKYVYGVSATVKREDRLDKINYMLLGPIRHSYSAKEQAKAHGIQHYVYPRFTRTVIPRFNQEKLHPNDAYEILRNCNKRDELIINDAKECILQNRTPVILSKYVKHSKKLYEALVGAADHIFLLSGANSKKEHVEILKQMHQVKNDESMILIATGSLIGEGFNFPRLDTLIMAMPIAAKSVVEQYAGRLNRTYDGKKSVVILDYVDIHIPMFDRMYHKRLRAYKQIGYSIYSDEQQNEQNLDIHSIYNIDNYFDIYAKDLVNAENEIIVSSPTLSKQKIDELNLLLEEKQKSGCKVIVITYKPDCYNFGDAQYWMQLQEQMRRNGFIMNLVEEYCERYCIIDRKIVWYGSLNFLGKSDIDDNLMRISNSDIAIELIELTFNNQNQKGESLGI